MKQNHYSILILFAITFSAFLLTGCPSEEKNTLPQCDIINPKDHSAFTPEDNLFLQFTAWDTDGEINTVQVFLDETLITTLDNGQNEYNIELSDLSLGDYALKLLVTDDRDGETTETIDFTVNPALSTFTDPRDGHVYRYVKIGTQTWMADNLAYLPTVDPIEDLSTTEPRHYVLNYSGVDVQEARNRKQFAKHGVLYNLPAALTAAPDGWHLPSHTEWMVLEDFIASEHQECELQEAEGIDAGDGSYFMAHNWSFMPAYLSYTSGWCCDANGRNLYGFSLLPCYSNRGYSVGESDNDESGFWWTSTQTDYSEDEIWMRHIYGPNAIFGGIQSTRDAGISIRCIKDE